MILRYSIALAAVAAAAVISAVPARAGADTMIRQQTKFASSGGGERVVTSWIGEGRIMTDDGSGKIIIVRRDRNVIWYIDHSAKSYSELPFGSAEAPLNVPQSYKPQAKVTETGETKKIGRWNCRKYAVTLSIPMGGAHPAAKTESEIWTTGEIDADAGLYASVANLVVSHRPGAKEALDELGRIKGFPVLRIDRTDFMGTVREGSVELLEVTRGTPPEGTYEVPDGYRKTGL